MNKGGMIIPPQELIMNNKKLFEEITDFIKNHFKRVDCQMVISYFDLSAKEINLCLKSNNVSNLKNYVELIKDQCILEDIKNGSALEPDYYLQFGLADRDNLARRVKNRYFYSVLQIYKLHKLGCLEKFIEEPTDYKSSFIYALEHAVSQRFREFNLIETLSEETRSDKSYLYRAWKRVYGEPLNEFITYLKIREAREIFKQKGYPAKHIHHLVGIGAIQTLNSSHRKLYGITFSEYVQTQTYRTYPVVNNGKCFYIVEGHKSLILEKVREMEEFNPLRLPAVCGFNEGVLNTMLTDIFGDTCIPYLKQYWKDYREVPHEKA